MKVDRNDLVEIHRGYTAVLSTLNEKKCSLNNAYRLAGTACSAIRLPLHSRAENCQPSDIPKYPGEAGRHELSVKRIKTAAGWPVAIGEMPLHRQAGAAGIGGYLLCLEGSVDKNKKRLPPSLKKSMTNSIKFS